MTQLDALQEGIRAVRRGRLDVARQALDAALAERPNDEVALSWRARASADPEEYADYLRRALAVNPGNGWASATLVALGNGQEVGPGGVLPSSIADDAPTAAGTTRLAAPGAGGATEQVSLQCPHCGGTVEISDRAGVKAVACQYCGSVLDLTTEQLDILGQTDPKVRPLEPIEPGMEATFDGKRHTVIGWVRYKGWDDEDTWIWDEWQLLDEDGAAHYLTYDPEAGFSYQTPLRPTAAFNPATSKLIEVPGGKAFVKERGPAEITNLRGELTWRPRLGQTLQVLDAVGPNRMVYSAEYSTEEIELVGGPRINKADVYRAFGWEEKAADFEAWAGRMRRRRRVGSLTMLASLVFFLGSCGAAFSGDTLLQSSVTVSQAGSISVPGLPNTPGGTGQDLFGQPQANAPDWSNPDPPPAPPAAGTPPAGAPAAGAGETDAGTFEVTAPGRAYALHLSTVPPGVGNWSEVAAWVIDPAGTRYPVGIGSFWEEAGRDSDGPWREDDTDETLHFRPTVQGTHRLVLELDGASGFGLSTQTIPVTATVKGPVWLARHFVIAGVIAGLLGLVLFLSSGNKKK